MFLFTIHKKMSILLYYYVHYPCIATPSGTIAHDSASVTYE